MGVRQVVEILAQRGLALYIGPDGRPHARGPREEITPAVTEALTAYRAEIIEHMRRTSPREFLWRYGHTYVEREGDGFLGHAHAAPVGAWWWRRSGSPWQPVPGRPGTDHPLPEGA